MRGLIFSLTLAGMPVASIAVAEIPPALLPDRIEPAKATFLAYHLARLDGKPPEGDRVEGLALNILMVDPDNGRAIARYVNAVGEDTDRRVLELQARHPDNADLNYALGRILWRDDFNAFSVPYLRKAADATGNRDWLMETALTAYFAEDYATCVAYYDRAFVGNQAHWSDRIKRGECHAFLGHKAEAKADFDQVVSENEGQKWAYSVRMFKDGVFNGCKGNPDGKVESGWRNRRSGKYYEAYRDAHLALMCNPKHIGALELRLEIESNDRNLRRHQLSHAVALANVKDNGATYRDRAAKLVPPKPSETLSEALAIDILSGGHDANFRRRKAAYLATIVLQAEPDNAQARLWRARALTNMGVANLAPLAFADATAALKTPATAAAAHNVRGVLLWRNKATAEALKEFDTAIALAPDRPGPYGNRGTLRAELGQTDAALGDLNRAIADTPTEGLLIVRAQVYLKKNDPTHALADAEAVRKFNSRNPVARRVQIEALDRLGQKDKADGWHIDFVIEDEKAARADPYLSQRDPTIYARATEVDSKMQAYQAAQRIVATTNGMFEDVGTVTRYIDRARGASSAAAAVRPLRSARNLAENCVSRGKALLARDGAYFTAEDRTRYDQAFGACQKMVSELGPMIDQLSGTDGDDGDYD
ncbi:tetratricopeptide repeat protein [Asticcacaulis sp. BYS171W]|uniref:Tetratricopeptide repeat protein n=1 Tax=Asticcacaulis aquaticus TaxID=2984212 RepID=A0ABT5HVF7_9CAUL|nr:tetratricopeptide repeat protein [Asticcacaulis aquaticus]MDC7683949.1 tetratricopeptide repeat protein [Asticcacaulis aquaticus]